MTNLRQVTRLAGNDGLFGGFGKLAADEFRVYEPTDVLYGKLEDDGVPRPTTVVRKELIPVQDPQYSFLNVGDFMFAVKQATPMGNSMCGFTLFAINRWLRTKNEHAWTAYRSDQNKDHLARRVSDRQYVSNPRLARDIFTQTSFAEKLDLRYLFAGYVDEMIRPFGFLTQIDVMGKRTEDQPVPYYCVRLATKGDAYAVNCWGQAQISDTLYLVLKRVGGESADISKRPFAFVPYFTAGYAPSSIDRRYIDHTGQESLGVCFKVGDVITAPPLSHVSTQTLQDMIGLGTRDRQELRSDTSTMSRFRIVVNIERRE